MQRSEAHITFYHWDATGKIPNVGNSIRQMTWFVQQINCKELKKIKEGKGNLQTERDFREIIQTDLAETLIQIKQVVFFKSICEIIREI